MGMGMDELRSDAALTDGCSDACCGMRREVAFVTVYRVRSTSGKDGRRMGFSGWNRPFIMKIERLDVSCSD